MKRYGRYIIGFGCSFVISLIGITLSPFASNFFVWFTLGALACLPPVLLVIGMLLEKSYVKRINRAKIADMQNYMLRHREQASEASDTLLKKLQRLRRITVLYASFLWLLAACISLLGGLLLSVSTHLLYLFVLYGGTLFCTVYARIHTCSTLMLDDNVPALKAEKYPYIYSIARRAAEQLGCRQEITVLVGNDCGASVVYDKGKCYIQIGIVLLNLLSEEELQCLFLHEFSHCSAKNRDAGIEKRYRHWLLDYKNASGLFGFTSNLFAAFDVHYWFCYTTYEYATSIVQEMAADRDMAKYGNPAAAASLLLKLSYHDRFVWEGETENEPCVYQAETPNPHFWSEQIQQFKTAIQTRHTAWNRLLQCEILPNNASHPTVKMRLETLGVQHAEIVADNSTQEYHNELEKALRFADKRLLEAQDTYPQDRQEAYLDPLERITAWEQSGMPVIAQQYADIVSDLKQIGRHRDAEALCERAIQQLAASSAAHAYFIKGCTLIRRYDPSGADLIYQAIEINHNYLEEGLHVIGSFYCMTGMEQQLLAYRERARQLAQKDKDEYRETDSLSKKDALSRDDMPQEMLQDILAYIASVDCDIIQNIYLVKKTISDTFFTSAFVIHFYGGTDAQRDEIMHKIFRYLDTYPVDWQFSLFDYFDCLDIKFDNIAGSLVYSKSNQKGE